MRNIIILRTHNKIYSFFCLNISTVDEQTSKFGMVLLTLFPLTQDNRRKIPCREKSYAPFSISTHFPMTHIFMFIFD